MFVVCPYVRGELHPDTRKALEPWQGGVLFMDVGGDDYAYGRLLRDLWARGETFCVIEHDVVPWAHTLPELACCPDPYCAVPYPWQQAVGVALGCTKFDSLLLRAYPDAVEIALRIPSNYGGPGHWRQLDVWLQAAVLRDLYGFQPHCHLPAVQHRNPQKGNAVTPRDAPLRTRVEGRCYLEPGLVERLAADVAGLR